MGNCKDCYNGCPDTTYDKCVKYTGDDIPALEICHGDPLSDIIGIILANIQSQADGTSIIPDIDLGCKLLTDALGDKEKNLKNYLQAFADGECTLQNQIDEINNIVGTQYSFDTSCLTVDSDASRDDILQAAITKVCSVDTRLAIVEADYVKASELDGLIGDYITNNTNTTNQYTKMVPYIAYEYYGPLTNFDSAGKGLASAGFDKVYICNGDNGTPDKRGRVAVGCNMGVPGGTFDSAVDPASAANYKISLKGKVGEFKHTLSTSEIPSHTHTVTDPGHSHTFQLNENGTGNSNTYPAITDNSAIIAGQGRTATATTGVIIAASGGGQTHTNTQPSIGANYIMHIP